MFRNPNYELYTKIFGDGEDKICSKDGAGVREGEKEVGRSEPEGY